MVYSQNTKKVSVTYTYYAPETMSIEESKHTALQRAQIQALADEFGSLVSQNTSTVVANKNGESEIHFFSSGGSNVRGEWIETIGEPIYEFIYQDHTLAVTIKVKGIIREIPQNRAILDACVLRNGFEARNEDDTFHNGDDMFISFQSPINGHLLVYLVDYTSSTAFCLLPYSNSPESSQHIINNKKYIFFSQKHCEPDKQNYVDEYTMTCNSLDGVEHNDIILVFSPNILIRESSSQLKSNALRQTSLSDFEKWKSRILSNSIDTQIITKSITIKN